MNYRRELSAVWWKQKLIWLEKVSPENYEEQHYDFAGLLNLIVSETWTAVSAAAALSYLINAFQSILLVIYCRYNQFGQTKKMGKQKKKINSNNNNNSNDEKSVAKLTKFVNKYWACYHISWTLLRFVLFSFLFSAFIFVLDSAPVNAVRMCAFGGRCYWTFRLI